MQPPIYVQIFHVAAFANRRYAGNIAAVMPMDGFPHEDAMYAIASENGVPETVFLVPEGSDYRLRWFTPTWEMLLCGHATLASAAVVLERLEPERDSVVFQSVSGSLKVDRADAGYIMDFPARSSEAVSTPPGLGAALGAEPVEVLADKDSYMAVLETPEQVRKLTPDFAALGGLDRASLIVTAPGDGDYDFISRYFSPSTGFSEDPVTGVAHCMMAPYWSKCLGRTELRAFQASRRGGEVACRLEGERVKLGGTCFIYMEGRAMI